MLEVRGIDAGYGDVQVLFGLSIAVSEKEIVTLLGSNGAGKTTTLRCICGVLSPSKGEVLFRGKSLLRTAAAERAGLGIALVPEGRELWPQLTVRENLELGAYHGRARAHVDQSLDRVHRLFPRLLERKSQLAGSLSGGEQQMCAIGRALMSEPALLLLDEPSLGLAPIVVDQMFGSHPRAAPRRNDHPPRRAEPGRGAGNRDARICDRDGGDEDAGERAGASRGPEDPRSVPGAVAPRRVRERVSV